MNLVYPMAAMVFYMFVIGIFNFITRKRAVQSGAVSLGFYKTYDTAHYKAPEFLVLMGRHYDNQFQLPPVYLMTVLTGLHLGVVSTAFAATAWIFILTRVVHSYFHVLANNVLLRAAAFFAGWLMVLAMWVQILILASH